MEDTSNSIQLAFDNIEQRLVNEIRGAQELQHSMLPKHPPMLDRFDIAAYWLPAHEMSGDFYDFIPIDSDRSGIVLGDVTGKGMPAAMIMPLVRSTLRMAARATDVPHSVLNILNQQLITDMAQRKPVSLLYAVLDSYQSTLTIANAGIPYPLMLQPDGRCSEIQIGGYPLGSRTRGFDYRDLVIDLPPNTTVVLYSDGIDEARNEVDDTYGFSRLPQIIEDKPELSAKDLMDTILADVLNYSGHVRQDDMTLMVIKAKETVEAMSGGPALLGNRAYQIVPNHLKSRVREQQGKIEGERKMVTLVRINFSHTSIQNRETLRQVTDTIVQVLAKHEGLLNRSSVNEISGFFGEPLPHLNNAGQALDAAIEIRDTLSRMGQEKDVDLSIKIVLYTGVVVVSDISDESVEFSQVDSLFKPANLLLERMPTGEIWVDGNTHKLTHADFEYSLLPPVEIDNAGQRLQPYLLGGLRPSYQFAHPDKIFLRHQPQLRRLEGYASDLINTGKGRIISIDGSAGVGKRRLVNQLKESLTANVVWVTSRCVPEKRRSSYAVFIPLLQRLLNLETSISSMEALTTQLEMGIEKLHRDSAGDWLFSVDDVSAYLKMVLLADNQPHDRIAFLSYQQLQRQIFVAIRDVLVSAAHRKPIVLMLDDLHWIDDASKNLMTFLIDEFDDIPLLLLCLSHSRNWWLRDRAMEIEPSNYESISLGVLSLEESAAFLDHLLPGKGIPELLKTRILRRANGNPFHMSQLVKLLQADGVLVDHDGEWLMLEDPASTFIPNTLEGVVSARIDRLNINAREIIQYAAVLGGIATFEMLQQMANFIPHFDYHFVKLQELGLIEVVAEEDGSRYQLERALIANIAYTSIPQQERRSHHAWIAQYLERQASMGAAEHYDLLAFHYAQSHNVSKAIEYLTKAGHHARRCFNNIDAITFYEQSLDLIRDAKVDPCDKIPELYEGLGDVLKAVGRYDDALMNYERRLPQLQQLRHIDKGTALVKGADINHKIAEVYIHQGAWDLAMDFLQSAAEDLITIGRGEDDIIDASSVSELLGDIYNHMGFVYSQQGNFPQAINTVAKVLDILRESDSPSVWAQAYGRLGSYYTKNMDLQLAETHLQNGVAYANQIGDGHLLSVFYNDLGVIAKARGHLGEAIEYYQKRIHIKKCLKEFDSLSHSYYGLAQIYSETEDVNGALLHLNAAVTYSQYGSSDQFIAHLYFSLASAYQRIGHFESALEFDKKYIEMQRHLDDEIGICRGQSHLCETYLEKGDIESALNMCSMALETAEMLNLSSLIIRNYFTLAQISQKKGDWKQAKENLDYALISAERADDEHAIAKAQRRIAVIYVQTHQLDLAKLHFYEALRLLEEMEAHDEVASIHQSMQKAGIV